MIFSTEFHYNRSVSTEGSAGNWFTRFSRYSAVQTTCCKELCRILRKPETRFSRSYKV